MIFVILGTQKFQLNRLLRLLDECVGSGAVTDRIVAQTGHSDYGPKNYEYRPFMDKYDFEQHIKDSDVVISHSGVGSVMTALRQEKPVIVFPRLAKFGEHVDDHQIEIARTFADRGYVLLCRESDDLPALIEKAKTYVFSKYESQTEQIIALIEGYLRSL